MVIRALGLCVGIVVGTISAGVGAADDAGRSVGDDAGRSVGDDAGRSVGDDAGLYLFRIHAERTPGIWPEAADPVIADLYVPRPEALLTALPSGRVVLAPDRASVRVTIPDGVTLEGEPTSAHRAASFVIDYDQRDVSMLRREMKAELGARPTPEELVRFVDAHVKHKSYRQGFSVASQVAASGEGDCTEHAVLLAALARGEGFPARLAFGLLMVEQADAFLVFGHAWTEIHDGRGWRLADATRPSVTLPDARLRYLPLLGLTDEGPGYGMSLMSLAVVMPTRVVQVGFDAGVVADAR